MLTHTYKASDGSAWHVYAECPPIPTRAYDWSAVHDDYGGPGDNRHVYAPTREAVVREVESFLWWNPDACYPQRPVRCFEAARNLGEGRVERIEIGAADVADAERFMAEMGGWDEYELREVEA